jgi:hypothetical protein
VVVRSSSQSPSILRVGVAFVGAFRGDLLPTGILDGAKFLIPEMLGLW